MHGKTRIRTATTALAALAALTASTAPVGAVAEIPTADPRIEVIDLGVLGGDPATAGSVVTAMNESGQVVGASSTDDPQTQHAFLWERGRMRDLGTIPGGGESRATAVSERGLVVGWARLPGPGQRLQAVAWQDGAISALPGAPDTASSDATAVNSRGEVAGRLISTDNVDHAALWRNGRLTVLDPPGSGGFITALDIDEQGRVFVKVEDRNDGAYQYWFWERGTFTRLPVFDFPPAMNAHGQIAGMVRDTPSSWWRHPVTWADGRLREGNTFQGDVEVHDINERGDVVGGDAYLEGDSGSDRRGFIWRAGESETTDLGDAGGLGLWPLAINNRRQIIAYGDLSDDQSHVKPFLIQDGRLVAIPTDSEHSSLVDINDRGEVSGTRHSGFERPRATLWRVH